MGGLGSQGEIPKASMDGQDGELREIREEMRTCRTCGAEFTARLVRQQLLGRALVFGNRQECDPCLEAREKAETREAKAQAKLRCLKVREDFRRRSGLFSKYWQETFASWEERGWLRSRAYVQVRHWAEGFPESPMGYPSLILYSKVPGVGKTTLAACVVNSLINRWEGDPDRAVLPVRYETGPSLNIRIRATYDIRPDQAPRRETEEEVYRSLRGVSLLILDDVGDPDKEPPSEHTRRVYFQVIDQRYADGLPVLLITNSQGQELERVLGPYTLDRLAEMAGGSIITVSGKTRRQRFSERSE